MMLQSSKEDPYFDGYPNLVLWGQACGTSVQVIIITESV